MHSGCIPNILTREGAIKYFQRYKHCSTDLENRFELVREIILVLDVIKILLVVGSQVNCHLFPEAIPLPKCFLSTFYISIVLYNFIIKFVRPYCRD